MMPGLTLDVVALDHSYSKPWSAHPDASNARPLKLLFMDKFPRNRSLEQSLPEPDIAIDVESVGTKVSMNIDVIKARSVMSETEKQLSGLREDKGDDWEEKVSKTGWTHQQTRLFNKINKILHNDRLARLTFQSNPSEAIQRRNQIDKTSKRFRQALASVRWDTRLTHWLHCVLVDNLCTPLLAAYIEVLQTLRTKVPSLIDRMTAGGGHSSRTHTLNNEVLNNMLKKSWDPVLNTYSQIKLPKLPGNPLILVAPSGPTHANSGQSKRMKYWTNQLSNMGKVIPVMMHTVNNGSGVSIAQCLEHMIMAVKTKVAELKNSYLNRPIVLLGWNIGALVACHVAVQDAVSAVVCLGFPYMGVGGGRGDADDPFLDSRTPTLFVIGQHANTSSVDDVEDLREKIRAENSLIVVGGADDNLRMSRSKRKAECVTQIMVDKLILDELSQFLGGILSHGPTFQESVVVDLSDLDLRKHRRFQQDTSDGVDDDTFGTRPHADHNQISQQGRMTIAKALRARALASNSGAENSQGVGTVGSNTNVSVPVRVKRKYTKRKNANIGVEASPRKRYRSTPTPPVASPVTSVQTPLSAGGIPSVAGAPELTGLLKAQSGLLPTFRILTEDGELKLTHHSSPPTSSTPLNQTASSILGTQDEPLIAYKLEDYNRRFGEQRSEPETLTKSTVTIEGLLRSQRFASTEPTVPTPMTSTPISSLLSLARQMPSVQITTAANVSTQIQQLLSSLARSTSVPATVSSSNASTVAGLIPLKIPSSQSFASPSSGLNFPTHQGSQLSQSGGVSQIQLSQSGGLSPIQFSQSGGMSQIPLSQSGGMSQVQLSQSGSPLQNSVPTLMSSLTKTTSITQGNLVKILTSSNTNGGDQKPEASPSVHRVQMPEFFGPSSVCSYPSKISDSLKSTSAKIQVLEGEPVPLSTSVQEQAPIHITVNRGASASNLMSLGSAPGSLSSGSDTKGSVLSGSNSLSLVATREPSSPDCEIISESFPLLTSKPIMGVTETPLPSLTQAGRSYSVRAPNEETLGKVSSMLESSPITEYSPRSSMSGTIAPHTISTASISNVRAQHPQPGGSGATVPVGHKPHVSRASPNVTVSYTATPKQSLSNLAATRTRRIKTPKQFDL